ncbi:DUF2567 domain-containing protein [Williamsia deligens]|uniref:DUF2567 domain-containing protein n=1 Tax=Williamsia deligens TaxID=321325 RepID=A0ABW3GEM0_9NOCA|nr:DUF2567 domain-containing protein [Williamsia deligens]
MTDPDTTVPARVLVTRAPRPLVVRSAIAVCVLIALGAVGGVVWGVIVPGVTGVVIAPGRAGSLGADTTHRFDAIALFACISAVVGVVGALFVWTVRILRGPVGALVVTIGSLAGSAVGIWLGGLVAHVRHPGPGGVSAGEYFRSAPGLRLDGARIDLTGGLDVSLTLGLSWAIVVIAPLTGLVVVLVRILAAPAPDLAVPADPVSGRGTQGGELVGDTQAGVREAVEGGRPPA